MLYASLRLWAMLKKECIQIKRDYVTYLFLIMVPFLEVILFGYIINTDAKHLPTVVISHDDSAFTHSLIQAFKNTDYFVIKKFTQDENEAAKLVKSGEIRFIITIPNNFSRDLIRNKHPHILIEGDATDPVAIGNAFHAADSLTENVLDNDLQGPLNFLQNKPTNFVVDTHALYNPAVLARYHTVPGVLTTILTIALVMLTAISITAEYEHGTMEMLLITPLRPIEVIIGKIIPHIIMAYILFFLTLLVSVYLFHVPFHGSLLLLMFCVLPYIISSLGIGVAVSTVSKSQFRAVNLANTYALPAILLSGFMFPFHAMPIWAQYIGNLLPATHYLRIIIGIMLKGSTLTEIWPDLRAILIFMVIIVYISFRYYRRTLD